MSLKEDLAAKAQKTIEEIALNVAINIKEKLEETADKGECEYFVSLNKQDEGVVTSEKFLELLTDLLDGVKIDVIEKEVFSIFKSKFLRFSW